MSKSQEDQDMNTSSDKDDNQSQEAYVEAPEHTDQDQIKQGETQLDLEMDPGDT